MIKQKHMKDLFGHTITLETMQGDSMWIDTSGKTLFMLSKKQAIRLAKYLTEFSETIVNRGEKCE